MHCNKKARILELHWQLLYPEGSVTVKTASLALYVVLLSVDLSVCCIFVRSARWGARCSAVQLTLQLAALWGLNCSV